VDLLFDMLWVVLFYLCICSVTFSFVFCEYKANHGKTNNKQQTKDPNPNTQQTFNNKKDKAFGKSEPQTLRNIWFWLFFGVLCLFPYVSTRKNKNTKGGPSLVCSVSFCF